MTTDAREPKRNYPIPAAGNDIADDFARLIEALTAIGVDVAGLIAALAGKAAAVHGHDQSAITGLVDALAGKASTDHNHALAGLTDVGVAGAAAYQVLALINGLWRPWTIDLTHATGTVSLSSVDGLEAALAGRQPADATLAALAAVVTAADRLIYATGADTFATATLTAFARSLLDDANSAAARVTLGLSAAVPGAFGLARLADADLPAAQTALGITAKASLRNRHLNPAFEVCHDRSTGATVVIGPAGQSYAFDGVAVTAGGGGAFTCSQVLKATPGGSPTRARFAVSLADTDIAAADTYSIGFPIEGIDVADLMFGTASARPFVWRGVVNAPAGTWGLSFVNAAGTRCYVTMFTISAAQANTDVLVTAVVPGDTSGTWIKDSSGVGIHARIGIAAGTSWRAPAADVWANGNFLGTAGQTNGMSSTANVFEVADIGLYAGTELPSWELPDFAAEHRRCQRQYIAMSGLAMLGTVDSQGSTLRRINLVWPVLMRAVPAVTSIWNAGAPGTDVVSTWGGSVLSNVGNATSTAWMSAIIANARL